MTMLEKICLKRLKRKIEQQITEKYDPALSRKIDCIIYLLEEGSHNE
jgi:hypothetical protein